MTHIFTFSGVHGSGKTTIINSLANRLTNIGKSVFVMQEFPFIPNIPIGTMDFQAWYQTAMEQRNKVVKALHDMFDIILLDRHPLDVDVYTARLRNSTVETVDIEEEVETMHNVYVNDIQYYTWEMDIDKDKWKHKEYTAMFIFERPIQDLLISLKSRRQQEEHRKDWGEEDTEYLEYIIKKFRLFKKNDKTIFINNKVLKNTNDLVFDHVIRRIRDE